MLGFFDKGFFKLEELKEEACLLSSPLMLRRFSTSSSLNYPTIFGSGNAIIAAFFSL